MKVYHVKKARRIATGILFAPAGQARIINRPRIRIIGKNIKRAGLANKAF
jgi:hypothetical protein